MPPHLIRRVYEGCMGSFLKRNLGDFLKALGFYLFLQLLVSLCLCVICFNWIFLFKAPLCPEVVPPNIHDVLFIPHLNWVYMTFLVLIPLLAMKLIAEEKKERTMDLLLTAPIGSLEIVVGKFLACWAAVTSMILLAFLFPLITSGVSDFDWGPLWGSYVGMIFLAGFNVSLCLVASSLTSLASFKWVFRVFIYAFNFAIWVWRGAIRERDCGLYL